MGLCLFLSNENEMVKYVEMETKKTRLRNKKFRAGTLMVAHFRSVGGGG